MVYKIRPFTKNGSGKVSNSALSNTLSCDDDKGFRNVAVGATIITSSGTVTVAVKYSDNTVGLTTSVAWTTKLEWTYHNPDLEFSGIYSIKQSKVGKPTLAPIPLKDSYRTHTSQKDGTYREIQLTGFITSPDQDDLIRNINILEGLVDGLQARGNTEFVEDLPVRGSYVYISSITWMISREKPKFIDINVDMVETKFRSS